MKILANFPSPSGKGQRMGSGSQHGLALVTALLVVAVVATVATYLSLGQQVWLRQVQNLFDRGQADNMRHAALDWVGMLLVREAKDNKKSDHLGETWAKSFPPLPFEGGALTATVSDAQGLFNLNNLTRGGAPSQPDILVFRQLLQSQGLDAALAESAIDWIDANGDGNAEDVEYLSHSPPYRSANQMLTSVDELRLVKGFSPAVVEKLRPYVTALPAQGTKINVNTAPDVVLTAMFGSAAAQSIAQERNKEPLDEPADVTKFAPPGQTLPEVYGFTTAYFLVRLDVLFGRWKRTTLALVQRLPDGKTHDVLWHHPLYPRLPRDDEESESKG